MEERQTQPRKTRGSKGALVAALLFSLIALFFLALDVFKPKLEPRLRPVYALHQQVQERFPYLVSALFILALIALVFYFLSRLRPRAPREDFIHGLGLNQPAPQNFGQQVSQAQPLSQNNRLAEKKVEEVTLEGVEQVARKLASREDLREIIEKMAENLPDKPLSEIMVKLAEKRPETITPAYLDQIIRIAEQKVLTKKSHEEDKIKLRK